MSAFYFLNVFKPKGITSFDVVFKLRKILNIKKIGHSGTLDPMAEGVMQLAIGRASRLLEFLQDDKEYIAEIQFGYTSTTLDKEGEISKCVALPDFTENDLKIVLQKFIGKIEQTPPKFSAIKINGKKLCDLARKNPEFEIEIKKRIIEIEEIELLEFNNRDFKAKIRVVCSKGTYIRTLADDIAQALMTRAFLTNLLRTRAGNFKIENSIKLDDITPETVGISPLVALSHLQKYELTKSEFELVKNGVKINSSKELRQNSPTLLTYGNKLVSIAVLSDNQIKIKKNFCGMEN